MKEAGIEESYRLLSKMYVAAGFKSQKEFARRAGLSQGYVSALLKPKSEGGREPSPSVAERIADLCGRTAGERQRYRDLLRQARVVSFVPDFQGVTPQEATSAPGMDPEFLTMLRNDLTRLPSRQRRKGIASAGLSSRMIQQVLRGKAVLDMWRLGRLAKGLGRNPGMYLGVAKLSDESFRRLAIESPDFVSALFDLDPPALLNVMHLVIGMNPPGNKNKARR